MTVDEYFVYVREYQRRLYEASREARTGIVDPGDGDEDDLDTLSDDEDPFTVLDEPFLLTLPEPVAC